MLYKISKILISTNMIIRDEEMQDNKQLFDQIEEEYPQYYIFPNIPSITFEGLNLIIPNLTYNINRDTILNLYAIMVFDLTKVNAAHVFENINKFIDDFKDTLNPRIIHLLETGRMHYTLAYNDQRFLKLALIDTAVRDNSNKPTETSSEKKPPNKRKGLCQTIILTQPQTSFFERPAILIPVGYSARLNVMLINAPVVAATGGVPEGSI